MRTLLLIAVLSVTLGCTQTEFSAFKKQEALQSSPLFGSEIESTQENDKQGFSLNTFGADVANLCSTGRSDTTGTNVISSEILKVSLIDPATGKEVCSQIESVRETIINLKRLPIKICENLSRSEYLIKLTDPSIKSQDLLYDKNMMNNQMRLVHEEDGSYSIRHRMGNKISTVDFSDAVTVSAPISKDLLVLYDNFRMKSFTPVPSSNNNLGLDDSMSQDGDDCDTKASPLIIDTTGGQEPPKLTSLTDGIQFDILGKNSFPRAHDKKQISWITNPSHKFLVLPDIHGSVNGIDQMFGDNTVGPDGKLAQHGFAALAKYDSNGDGAIKANEDLIFNKLRLWSDKNRDGRSSPSELETLSEAGIVAIDLVFDENYQKTDRFGNKIKYKSIVKYRDGKVNVIYDIWFRFY